MSLGVVGRVVTRGPRLRVLRGFGLIGCVLPHPLCQTRVELELAFLQLGLGLQCATVRRGWSNGTEFRASFDSFEVVPPSPGGGGFSSALASPPRFVSWDRVACKG